MPVLRDDALLISASRLFARNFMLLLPPRKANTLEQ